jgi:hypothetical protein
MQDDPEGHAVGAWNLAAKHSTGDILIQFSATIGNALQAGTKCLSIVSTRSRRRRFASPTASAPTSFCRWQSSRANSMSNTAFSTGNSRSQYSDAEFTVRAEKASAIIDARDIVFAHHHPAYEPAIPTDSTHRRVNDPAEAERAKAIFEELTK